MSEASSATSRSPEDQIINQAIIGLEDGGLSPALLLESIEHGPPFLRGEQFAPETADESQDFVEGSPILSLNGKAKPTPVVIPKRTRKHHHIVVSPQDETKNKKIDKFSDISSKEKLNFRFGNHDVVVKIEDLKDKGPIDAGTFGHVIELPVMINQETSISIAVKCVRNTDSCKLRKELTILEKLVQHQQCPYIPDFYGALWNKDFGGLCFFMEFVQTNLLKAYKKLHDMIPVEVRNVDLLVRRVAFNIVSALKFMYGHGLSHNDIKPANILVDRQGHVKLADFGESDDVLGNESIPHPPRRGTLYYWPPEYTRSDSPCSSERSNLWALALTLVEICIGEHPYAKGTTMFGSKSHLETWTPDVLLDKISQGSYEFIVHLFQRPSDAGANIYENILQLPYLSSISEDPSAEEIILFESITR